MNTWRMTSHAKERLKERYGIDDPSRIGVIIASIRKRNYKIISEMQDNGLLVEVKCGQIIHLIINDFRQIIITAVPVTNVYSNDRDMQIKQLRHEIKRLHYEEKLKVDAVFDEIKNLGLDNRKEIERLEKKIDLLLHCWGTK